MEIDNIQISKDIVMSMINILWNRWFIANKLWIKLNTIKVIEKWGDIKWKTIETILISYKKFQEQINQLPKISF